MVETGLTEDQLYLALLLASFNMGIFAGLDARRQRRSFLVWFAVGFLLAPFGILIWLFVRDTWPRTREREPAKAEEPPSAPVSEAPGPGAAPPAEALAPPVQPLGSKGTAERRYAVLTALSRAAAKHPEVELGDLLERVRKAHTRAEFDAIEEEIRRRTRSPEPPL